MERSPQQRAEQLLYLADAVQKSIQSRKEQRQQMNKERLATIDDFEASAAELDTAHLDISTMLKEDDEEISSPPVVTLEERTSRKDPTKKKGEKKSKTKVIADLRQQLQDCRSALVEIKENASLKELKLELACEDLKESYSSLEEAKAMVDKEVVELKRKLSSSLGAENVEMLSKLESNKEKLEKELEKIKSERDAFKKQVENLRKSCCESCLEKMKKDEETTPEAEPLPPGRGRSLWGLLRVHLEDEAKMATLLTTSGSESSTSEEAKPPVDLVVSKTEDDDVDADLEAMEKKMKNDIENMRREWERPNKKRVDTHSARRGMRNKRTANLSKTKSARSTLDSFFSKATLGFGDEEMDEEKSFYSRQKSITSAPAAMVNKSPREPKEKKQVKNKTMRSAETRDVDGNTESSESSKPSQSIQTPDKRSSLQKVFSVRDAFAAEAKASPEAPASVESPLNRRGLLGKAMSIKDGFDAACLSLSGEEVNEGEGQVPEKKTEKKASETKATSFEGRMNSLQARSMRGDLVPMMEQQKVKYDSFRSSQKSGNGRADQKGSSKSTATDEQKRKIAKEVEAWAAVDMAPITML